MKKIIEVIGDMILDYGVYIGLIAIAIAYLAASGTFTDIMDTIMTNLQAQV